MLEKVYDDYLEREKDVYRPCHCQETLNLQNRFKNALIPSEFENARFDNYEQATDVQQTLFKATTDYLKTFQSIVDGKPEHNSMGFIAVLGESRIRGLDPRERYQAKAEHNNFGLGKTHLQMAAAKYIMRKIKVRDEISPNRSDKKQYSRFTRGCRVLCVSDVTFMDDLINAKRMNDEGVTLAGLLNSALKVDVLVWDDLGKAKWSESKENFYYQIINHRYLHKLPILFSSNEDTGTLSEKIGYAASSRLLGMCGERLYKVEGADYRLRKGA
ncbi:ATP-binding protein [Sediminibacillus massiliensis]|uniref:ATP-binding protein n=1 Tax=Sediminibacillus massiliensis TaxID=1926277 RepID=UPI001FE887DD|nr:ATP-binding protein [Sediminibacillus massiliensis]